jgi:hypothetical protein
VASVGGFLDCLSNDRFLLPRIRLCLLLRRRFIVVSPVRCCAAGLLTIRRSPFQYLETLPAKILGEKAAQGGEESVGCHAFTHSDPVVMERRIRPVLATTGGCGALVRTNVLKFRRDFRGGRPWAGQKRAEAATIKICEMRHGLFCCGVTSERALPLVRGSRVACRCNFGYGEEKIFAEKTLKVARAQTWVLFYWNFQAEVPLELRTLAARSKGATAH